MVQFVGSQTAPRTSRSRTSRRLERRPPAKEERDRWTRSNADADRGKSLQKCPSGSTGGSFQEDSHQLQSTDGGCPLGLTGRHLLHFGATNNEGYRHSGDNAESAAQGGKGTRVEFRVAEGGIGTNSGGGGRGGSGAGKSSANRILPSLRRISTTPLRYEVAADPSSPDGPPSPLSSAAGTTKQPPARRSPFGWWRRGGSQHSTNTNGGSSTKSYHDHPTGTHMSGHMFSFDYSCHGAPCL